MVRLEPGLKLRLKEERSVNPVPNEVCHSCHQKLSKLVVKGAVLRSEAKAKEQNRLMLWRNRVALVKQGKQQLQQKAYSDAAVSYEKYLRILELVYEKEVGELTPELFRNSARSKELTVITSVYWDLMRIYDSSAKFNDRQMKVAIKLADFARFTKIFPTIMKNAEAQVRQARNPAAYKKFIQVAQQKSPRCFIATAAFDHEITPTIVSLTNFRDEVLQTHLFGRGFIKFYYLISPSIAQFLDEHPALKPPARKFLTWLARNVDVKQNS